MRKRNGETGNIMMCVVEVLVGILLLINPIGFTSGIIFGVGCLLIVLGAYSVFKYFKMDAGEAAVGQYLAKGLLEILAGLFCAFNTQWFIATFPILTILYGLLILVTGFMKVQLTVDMLRLKYKKWVWAAVNAVISVVCAIVILSSPFTSTAILWTFTGVSLIIEAFLDVVTIVMKGKDSERL